MKKRNATGVVIGAGGFIGGKIVKKFASERGDVFVRRRQGEKVSPPVNEIQASGVFGSSLREAEIVSLLGDADKHVRWAAIVGLSTTLRARP